jgi:hypothetical protein
MSFPSRRWFWRRVGGGGDKLVVNKLVVIGLKIKEKRVRAQHRDCHAIWPTCQNMQKLKRGHWENSKVHWGKFNKGFKVHTCFTKLICYVTCCIGPKISWKFFALLPITIFSLNFNLILSIRFKSFNNDTSSFSRYSLVFCTVEIYNDLCYITGLLRCRYTPRHKCCILVWCNAKTVYRSRSLN